MKNYLKLMSIAGVITMFAACNSNNGRSGNSNHDTVADSSDYPGTNRVNTDIHHTDSIGRLSTDTVKAGFGK